MGQMIVDRYTLLAINASHYNQRGTFGCYGRVRVERVCQWLSMRRNIVWLWREGNRMDVAEKRRGYIASCLAGDDN